MLPEKIKSGYAKYLYIKNKRKWRLYRNNCNAFLDKIYISATNNEYFGILYNFEKSH